MAATATATRWTFDFTEGDRSMRDLLGGKGAGIAEMVRVLGPDRVPAGFTITTEACVAFLRAGGSPPAGLVEEIELALGRLEAQAGKRLGSIGAPALVVWGPQDPYLPLSFGRAYAERLPNAELLELDGAGHWPWIDRPDAIDRIVGFVAG